MIAFLVGLTIIGVVGGIVGFNYANTERAGLRDAKTQKAARIVTRWSRRQQRQG